MFLVCVLPAQKGRIEESKSVLTWVSTFNTSAACCFPSAVNSNQLKPERDVLLLASHQMKSDARQTDLREIELVDARPDSRGSVGLPEEGRQGGEALTSMLSSQAEPSPARPSVGALTALFAELRRSAVLLRCAVLLWLSWFTGVCGYVNLNVFFPELLDRLGHGSTINAVVFTALGLIGECASTSLLGPFLGLSPVTPVFLLGGLSACFTICMLHVACTLPLTRAFLLLLQALLWEHLPLTPT